MGMLLQGKRVFITGASSGIGAALAREFARQGANVALGARRADRLEALAEEIRAAGGEALALPCDVTDRPSLDAAFARAAEAWGGVDVAVANAGFGVSGPMARLTTADYRRQLETNVFGVIDTAYAAMPYLEAAKGRLVLVSSVLGRVGSPGTSAYCVSKFAVTGLAESIVYELAERGVGVTMVTPGLIESEFRSVDNAGQRHEDMSDPAPRWLVMPTARAARLVVRAAARGRFEVILTRHGKLAVFLNRHFPRTFRWAMGRLTRGRMDRIEQRKRGRINREGG